MKHRHHTIAVLAWVACLLLTPREAVACSCVDWSLMPAAEARKAFLDDWTRAEAAVSGTVISANDLETVVRVSRVLKGEVSKVLKIFPRPPQPKVEKRGDGFVMQGSMDCRPLLDSQTEYLILLFRSGSGVLDSGRCAVWTERDREQRLRWIPQG